MSTSSELPEQLRQNAYRVGAEQIKRGVSGTQLKARLIEIGLDPVSANTVAGEVAVMWKQYQRRAGKRGLLWGVIGFAICAAALVIRNSAGPISFQDVMVSLIVGALFGSIGAIGWGLIQVIRYSGPRGGETRIDPIAWQVAKGIWDGPRTQQRLTTVAVFAVLGLIIVDMLLHLATPVPAPLISVPAATLNLNIDDPGAGFALTVENSPSPSNKNVREINQRTFESNEGAIYSVVMMGIGRSLDHPAELLANFEAVQRQTVQVDLSFGTPSEFAVGERGAIEEVAIGTPPNQQQGYVAAFIKNNVIVVLTEIGPAGIVTPTQLEAHARKIESRIH